MKKIISSRSSALLSASLLFCFLAACLITSPVPTPASVLENTATPAKPALSTPIPTFTAVVPPTIELPTLTPPSSAITVIQFKAGGTYSDIADNIALGSSKTYSINAMKGQIMSISILPQIPGGGWGYIPMQIKGADGNILCPQSTDSECVFWRGVLPSSQDYFVTLTPNGDAPKFTMRVAINPPGKDNQFFQYNNPATGLSLTYPDTFAPAIPVVGNYKMEPELALHLIDPKAYDKTNLREVYLFVSSASDAEIVASCTEPNQSGGGPEQVIGNEIVNGYTFVHSTSDGAGAGNFYQQEIYRMVNQGMCYEAIYFIHSTNIGNYTPGTVTEFDRDAIIQKLRGVFFTFTIK